jgi:hypothetical protein
MITVCKSNLNGYKYFCDSDNAMAWKNGVVYHHRQIAAEKIGRPLTRNEIVHHIDGNRSNNHPDNLEVMTRAQHIKEHGVCPERKISKPCIVCGSPSFTKHQKYCCRKCAVLCQSKLAAITPEIIDMVKAAGYEATGRAHGVSGNAIRKRIKKLSIA